MATSSHRHLITYYLLSLTLMLASVCSAIEPSAKCSSPDLEKCQCFPADGLIECSGLDKFPESTLLQDFANLMFDKCNFPTIDENNSPEYATAATLVLNNCKIQHIADNALNGLMQLRELSIENNFIKNISSQVLYLPQLNHLTLVGNELTTMPEDTFSNLLELERLSLAKNTIPSLPAGIFKDNTKLSTVDIGFNKLTSFPRDALLSRSTTLTNLVIAGNPLHLEANMFKDFPELAHLDVSTLNLESLDVNTFSGLSKLRELRLSNNKLREIPREALADMRESLHQVWLDNNELQTLENGTLPHYTLTDIQLGHNPWHCDKNIAWMKDLHLEKIDHENVTCSTPEALAGRPLSNVTREILHQQPPIAGNRRTMIAAAIAIPIIVICVLAIFCIIVRLVQNKRNQKRAQVRYSAVYRDTVETAPRGYRPTSNI